jgi:pyruvate,water dikinase
MNTMENENKKINSGNNEVGGLIAYRGFARGKVRVITAEIQSVTISENEILVCTMTSSHLNEMCAKASAFVTDEGGVICHAAVVARQMKKPCIIGTKNATKVFKDGDTVEVDAMNGVVRKIYMDLDFIYEF